MNITFIGGGNMAAALIEGLLQQGQAADLIDVIEPNSETRNRLAGRFKVKTHERLTADNAKADAIVLAVKPQQLKMVASELAPLLSKQLVISIAAGIRAPDLAKWLGGHGEIVRVMPNTPAQVLAGVSGVFALPRVDLQQRQLAAKILSSVGSVLWLENEAQLDAVTAVSGSGPAYVFYFLEALAAAATELGFDQPSAGRLALETFEGAIKLARESGEDPAQLRAKVTSKGGTTERALLTMEQAGVKARIVEGVLAAAERSRELGDELAC